MIRPGDIEQLWPKFRERALPWLDDREGGEAALLQEVRDKRAFCWCSKDAVVVLSLAPAADGGCDLFVRMAVSLHPTVDTFERYQPDIEKIATDLGAKRIRFRSTRGGWLRVLDSRWTVSHVEYVRDLPT
jgi:hypothetical protein